MLSKLDAHMNKVLRAKYDKMKALEATKDASPAQGRAYVQAYVDYIHSIAGMHAIIAGKSTGACAADGAPVAKGGPGC